MKLWKHLLLPGLATVIVAPVAALAQPKAPVEKAPPPTPVPTSIATPPVRLVLGPAQATSTPRREGCEGFVHTGGGNLIVSQPSPTVLTFLMTGAALAKGQLCKTSLAAWEHDLTQEFGVVYGPQCKGAKLTLEGRLIGALRSPKCCCCLGSASADIHNITASISAGPESLCGFSVPPRTVACGDNQAVYAREGPICVPILPGCYTLHQTFDMTAVVTKAPLCCKGPAAEFAPEPAYDPALYGIWDPFIGTATRDFGFRVTIRVEEVRD